LEAARRLRRHEPGVGVETLIRAPIKRNWGERVAEAAILGLIQLVLDLLGGVVCVTARSAVPFPVTHTVLELAVQANRRAIFNLGTFVQTQLRAEVDIPRLLIDDESLVRRRSLRVLSVRPSVMGALEICTRSSPVPLAIDWVQALCGFGLFQLCSGAEA
jgi:hypothetical protein